MYRKTNQPIKRRSCWTKDSIYQLLTIIEVIDQLINVNYLKLIPWNTHRFDIHTFCCGFFFFFNFPPQKVAEHTHKISPENISTKISQRHTFGHHSFLIAQTPNSGTKKLDTAVSETAAPQHWCRRAGCCNNSGGRDGDGSDGERPVLTWRWHCELQNEWTRGSVNTSLRLVF